MGDRHLAAGTKILFGVPANPMPKVMADAIGQAVAQVAGIREAYVPQCYIQGDTEARQVLVLGVDSRDGIPAILQELMGKMKQVLPEGQFTIDILPFLTSSMPNGARVRKCKIYDARPKPWWKLW
jgi:hypothetical protein